MERICIYPVVRLFNIDVFFYDRWFDMHVYIYWGDYFYRVKNTIWRYIWYYLFEYLTATVGGATGFLVRLSSLFVRAALVQLIHR